MQIQHHPSVLGGPRSPWPPSPTDRREERRLPGNEDKPSSPEGYVVSLAHFHKRGFAIPAHKFLRGLLDYYQVELQHFTPNGIQHIALFVALCEGFLAISRHFDLWRYLFAVNLLKKRVGKQELHAPVGCAGIHLRNNRVEAYLLMCLPTSNKGWHSQWFYVKDDAAAPCQFSPGASSWRSGGHGSGVSRSTKRRTSTTFSPPSKL